MYTYLQTQVIILNMYSLLHASYTWIKWFKKKENIIRMQKLNTKYFYMVHTLFN